MKAKRFVSLFLAAGLGLAAATHASDVLAQPKGKAKKEAAPETPTETPVVKKAIEMPLPGLRWGMSPKQVAEAVDKVLDEDYRPKYKTVQPGVKMKELDAQLAEDKSQFRRSRIDFGKLPTGIDATPLRGEYTYQNKEALLSLVRNGATTYFFFIQEKLWKVIEEHKGGASDPLGKTWVEAVVNLTKKFETPGKISQPDATHFATEVDWKDAETHVRAIQRSDTALGLAFEDVGVAANIASMRPNKPADDNGIDPEVAALVRKEPPPPPPEEKKDDKKKPKK